MAGIFKWTNPNTGLANANISGTSKAVIIVNAFGTVDFLLDNTSSMMLPADDTQLLKLQTFEQAWLNSSANVSRVASGPNLTGWNKNTNQSYSTSDLPLPATANYCAFACHWASGSSATNQLDYYGVAKAAGETLRFDEVQSATQIAITEMESLEKTLGQLAVGVFAFGGQAMSSTSYLTTIYAETPLDIATSNQQ